jgi:hypothetical protein
MNNRYVLKFSSHSLAIFCYGGIYDVCIDYAQSRHDLTSAGVMPENRPEYENRWPSSTSGSYVAFAGPLTARWKTRDGSSLNASIDLDTIFPDRAVVHSQDPNLIHRADPFVTKEPIILIEIDHRTVNIYMFTTIRLDNPAGPKPFASSRERILAYTRTYEDRLNSENRQRPND